MTTRPTSSVVRRAAVALLTLVAVAAPARAQDPAAPKPPGGAPAEEKPWKVEDPHGPFKDVSFETDEGTWMALDVHPDGRTIGWTG